MLSYRHSFHAGNFADVIKHIILVEILEYLTQKEKPFEYIDTHSGAGLFNLKSADAKKLEEHEAGIGRISQEDFPEIDRYFEVVHSCNPSIHTNFYPGSPSIAKYFLRPQDRAWLFELHPQDYKLLSNSMKQQKKIRVACEDGLKGLDSLLPPMSRRGLVLIDPSYEIKSEYDQVVSAVEKAYKKFPTGTYAVWYPVVDRSTIDRMERKFIRSGIKNIQRFELGVSPDSSERGMTAAGMFVVNPPWTLLDKMSQLLPRLAQALGENGHKLFKCDLLSGE